MSWLLWLGVVASAKSDPCESIKEKADAFTGQPVRTYLAVGGWRVTASADAIQLEWELVQNDPHRDALPAGTVLKVRTEDGTIVDLVSKGETNPERKVVGSSVFTHWAATWTVSPEAAAAIAKSPPAAMQAEAIGLKWTLVTKISGADATPGFGPAFEKLHAVMGCLAGPPAP